jgi:hypothetical protein
MKRRARKSNVGSLFLRASGNSEQDMYVARDCSLTNKSRR